MVRLLLNMFDMKKQQPLLQVRSILTHKLTVCAGSSGPGNLHLINGLFDCHRNRVPVLAIASHIPQSERLKLLPRNTSRKLIQRMFLFQGTRFQSKTNAGNFFSVL